MTTDHDRLRDLVLNLEELEGDAREQAERHHETCASCRRLLDAVREVERQVREMPEIPFGTGKPLKPLEALDHESREAAERSRRDILRRIEAARSGPSSSTIPRLLPPLGAAGLLLAAVVATLLFWPQAELDDGVRSFAVAPAAQTRSATEGWSEGDAFILRFELARAGYPLVIHLGEDGRPELLHPERADLPLEPASADVLQRLPPAGSEEAWVFEGSGTRETFLLCTSPSDDLALDSLVTELRRRAEGAGSRADAVAAVEEHLRREVGPTARRDLRLGP